jgi:hypothetical protein
MSAIALLFSIKPFIFEKAAFMYVFNV